MAPEIGLGAEAIAYLRSRVPLTEDAFRRLADELKSRAFTVAGVAKLDLLQGILDEITRAIKDGTTFEDFKAAMADFAQVKGWKGLTPYRLDNVFRTNVQTAYNVGRYRQMTDPEVLGSRAYWQYDAVMDRRTRPTHAALDGRVWRADDPFWDTWYPQNGYRCRC
ncbi:MAG: phage head morphogenesis protein, partial [Desulfobacteria bacterium]